MTKRLLALLLSVLIVFTEMASGPMIAHATELSEGEHPDEGAGEMNESGEMDEYNLRIQNWSYDHPCAVPTEYLEFYADFSWNKYVVDDLGNGYYEIGDISGATYTWSVSDPNLATISSDAETPYHARLDIHAIDLEGVNREVIVTVEVSLNGVTKSESHYVTITNEHYYITSTVDRSRLADLDIGETITIEPKLYHRVYTYDQGYVDTEIQSDVTFRWDNHDSVTLTQGTGGAVTVERINECEGDVWVEAVKDEDGFVYTSERWTLNRQNYDIRINPSGLTTFVNADSEPVEVSLDLSNYRGKENHAIVWSVGFDDEDGEFVEIEECFDIDEVNHTLTLDLYAAKNKANELAGNGPEDVCVKVIANYMIGSVSVSEVTAEYNLRNESVEENFDSANVEDTTILFGDTHRVNDTYECWVNNANEEGNIYLGITSVEATYVDNGDPVLVYHENGEWIISPERAGEVEVSYTYQKYGEEEGEATGTGSFLLTVSLEKYRLNVEFSKDSNQIFPGETIQLNAYLNVNGYDPNTEEFYERPVEGYFHKWTIQNEDLDGLVELDYMTEDHSVVDVIVDASAPEGDIVFLHQAFATADDDEPVAEQWVYVGVTNGYYEIKAVETEYELGVGENVTITPELVFITPDGEIPTADVRFYFEGDLYAFEITDAENNVIIGENASVPTEEAFVEGTFKVTKLDNSDARLEVVAKMESDNEEDEAYYEVARKEYWFNSASYNIDFVRENEDEPIRFWVGAPDGTVEVNLGELANKNIQIEWHFGYWGEEGFEPVLDDVEGIYTVDDENPSIATIHTEALYNAVRAQDRGDCDVYVIVKINGQEVASNSTMLDIRKETAEYEFEIGEYAEELMGSPFGFSKRVSVRVENAQHPDGTYEHIEIVSVAIANASDEAGSPVAEIVEWENQEGWDIRPLRMGHAVLTITYNDIYGNPKTKTSQIYIIGKKHNLTLRTELDEVLANESTLIEGYLSIDEYREPDGIVSADATGYTFEWQFADDVWNQYAELVPVETEESGVACVELFMRIYNHEVAERLSDNWIDIELIVYAPMEEGGYEVARETCTMHLTNKYYVISQPEWNDTELAIGKSVTHNPETECHKYGVGITTVENVTYFWSWDPNVLALTDAEGNELSITDNFQGDWGTYVTGPVTFTRVGTGNTYIGCMGLIPGDESNYECLRGYGWCLRDTEYELEFEELRGEGYTFVYAYNGDGEDYELSIKTKAELLEICDVEWRVVKGIEDGGEWRDVEIELETGAYSISEDGTTIIIHSKQLAEKVANITGDHDAEWEYVEVYASLITKSNGTELASNHVCVDLKAERYEYYDTEYINNLPTDIIEFLKKQKVYAENSAYPNGGWPEIEVEGVRVESPEGGTTDVLLLEELNDRWTITSVQSGTAYVIISFTDLQENECEHIIEVNVSDDIYNIEMWPNNGTDRILRGGSDIIYADLYHFTYDEEDGVTETKVTDDDLIYEWGTNTEDASIVPYQGNPSAARLTVANVEDFGPESTIEVWVNIYRPDEEADGGRAHIASKSYIMHVCDSFYQLFSVDVVYARPGEVVEVPARMKYFTVEDQIGSVPEDVIYGIRAEDTSYITVSDTNTWITVADDIELDEGSTFEQWITVTARVTSENGDEIYEEYNTRIVICNHDFELVSTVDPLCEVAGHKDYECKICGYEWSDEIEELGHNTVTDKAVAATCTTAGKTEGYHCSRCNTVFLAQHTVNPLGHSSVKDAAVAPTCTKEGKEEGSHCSRCNTVLVAQAPLAALGHNAVKDAAVAPTCSKEGKTEGSHCSRCNTILKAQTAVAKTSHTYEDVVTKASMNADGSIVKTCKSCGAKGDTTVIAKISSVTLDADTYVYDAKVKKPAVVVKDSKGNTITSYTVTYASGCKNPGRYSVNVTFTGNYTGTQTLNFTIAPKAVKISSLTSDKKTFTAKWSATLGSGYELEYSTTENFTKKTTKAVVLDGENTKSKKITGLKETEKYYVRVRAFVTVTEDGKQKKIYSEWSVVETVITETAKGKISAIKSVKLAKEEYEYDGKVKKPEVIIKDKAGNTLEEGNDYKVSYASGCKNPGSYKVTVTYLGNYKSLKKVTLYFTIAPAGVSISKVTATSKGFKVTYGKGTGNTGYEIQYSTSKKFTKSTTKTTTVSKAKTTSATVKKLKGNKTYYVRIRTYKTVKVNGKSVKLYSDWSKTKSVKTKK